MMMDFTNYLFVGILKAVADASYRLDPAEAGSQLFPERSDMHIDVAVDNEGVAILDVVKKLIASQNFAAALDKAA